SAPTRWASIPALTPHSAPTGYFSTVGGYIWRTFAAWPRCLRLGAGSSWQESGRQADRAHRPPYSALFPSAPSFGGALLTSRWPVNGQIVGLGSLAGTAKCGGFSRSMKSSSELAAASRLVKAGRFHFASIVASTEVWSYSTEET